MEFFSIFILFNIFWINFCLWYDRRPNFILLKCEYLVFPAVFIKEIIFCPLCLLDTFVENQLILKYGFLCGLSVLYHWSVPYCFDNYSFVVDFKSSLMSLVFSPARLLSSFRVFCDTIYYVKFFPYFSIKLHCYSSFTQRYLCRKSL